MEKLKRLSGLSSLMDNHTHSGEERLDSSNTGMRNMGITFVIVSSLLPVPDKG